VYVITLTLCGTKAVYIRVTIRVYTRLFSVSISLFSCLPVYLLHTQYQHEHHHPSFQLEGCPGNREIRAKKMYVHLFCFYCIWFVTYL